MASSKTKITDEETLLDADIEGIPEEDETECADDLWEYYMAHKDEVEDLEEWARKRGLKA
ncbi:MAG TPA: hypothetical protein VN455_08290 [Methanotrichaceae archaeon]|nr:hypothetical protein [Methanotrichaceae archaeon]